MNIYEEFLAIFALIRPLKLVCQKLYLVFFDKHVPEIFLISPTERPASSDRFFGTAKVIATARQVGLKKKFSALLAFLLVFKHNG